MVRRKTTEAEIQRDNLLPDLPVADTDLRGLYKAEQRRTILGKQLRYYAPDEVQTAIVMRAITIALQDLVSSPKAREEWLYEDLEGKCIKLLTEIHEPASTPAKQQERNKMMNRFMLHPEANEYFAMAIEQCFPDIPDATLLTSNARSEAVACVMKDVEETFKELAGNA